MKFSTLYKKTQTGAIQTWQIRTENDRIITNFGQLNGKIQETSDVIREGKNLGRSNSTTIEEQAVAEAKSQWDSKIKKGYVEEIERAKNSESNFAGGYSPMLAHKFSEQGHKIIYPAYVQPKLDGHRCTIDDLGDLWSRSRKPITGVPHISEEIKETYKRYSFIPNFDGELYNHELKADFENITHFVRQEEPQDGADIVQYHIYDMVHPEDLTFEKRYEWLKTHIPENSKYLKLVETIKVNNEDELMEAFDHYISLGYEGAIVRNANAKYEHKRSYNLQKIKEFDDAEFPIMGIEEGRGKLMGHVGSFICKTKDGTAFKAKMKNELSNLKDYFDNHNLWEGKILTVQFQGYTKYGIPRFPVGLRIREDA